ncbi:MAG: Do family serine endopeptidase, partial [Bacteroidota bacterium]
DCNLRLFKTTKTNILLMKKVIATFLVAALGGGTTLIIEKAIESSSSKTQLFNNNNTPKISKVNLGNIPEGTINFVKAAESTVNSVVHIKTLSEEKNAFGNDPFYQFFYGQRKPQLQQGSGSGVIISQDGYIVTNNHVIERAEKIEVILNDKRSFEAEVIGKDPTTDLALVKIKAKDLPSITYGNSDDLRIGEWVLAVGNPFNLTSTVTAGIVSAKGRNINILENNPSQGLFPIESFIQTDAAVNPGNSGGALVNANGELVGINAAIASNTGSYSGYSFAIPVNIVKKIVADLVEFGTPQRAFIGVSIRDIDATFAEKNGLKNLNGVYVSGVTDGGAAEDAGIKKGDIITKINNVSVKNVAELQEQIGKYRPGDKVTVTVDRDGKLSDFSTLLKNKEGTIGMFKKEEAAESTAELGAMFEACSPEECKELKINGGVKVNQIGSGKFAMAGIREGFVITAVDNKKVKTTSDLNSILKNKSGGTLIQGIYPNNPGKTFYYGIGL